LGLTLFFLPRRPVHGTLDHATLGWPRWWRRVWFLSLAGIVLASSFTIASGGRVSTHPRWNRGVHTFTWGAGIAAMKENRR
jgi:hypothetical protein